VVHRRLTDLQHLVTLQTRRPAPLGVEPALLFIPVSDRGALRRLRRLRGVELPVPLFDAASTCSPRVGEVRLPPAGVAVAVRRRPRGRAGAGAFVAVVGVLAEAVFFAGAPLL